MSELDTQIAIASFVVAVVGTIYTYRAYRVSKAAASPPPETIARQTTVLGGVILMESFFNTPAPPEPGMTEAMHSGQLGDSPASRDLLDLDSHAIGQLASVDAQNLADWADIADAGGDGDFTSYLGDLL